MKITSTYRKKQTELYNENALIAKTENGVELGERRFKNDREKFYAVELSHAEVLQLIKISGYKLMPWWMVKVVGWFK
jgi:hypothetical protein